MSFRLAIALMLFALTHPFAFASDENVIERWDRVVCIQSKVEGTGNTAKLCSAFCVSADKKLYLVTAGHASEETNQNSRLSYRDANGESQWVSLRVLFPGKANPWQRDKTSDFAIARIDPREKGRPYFSQLLELAVPLERVCTDLQPRATRIDVAGFPIAIGASVPISPVAVVGFVASREIESSTPWGTEPIVYCSPAIAQGTSGGPAFLGDESPGECTIIGMYIGVIADASGAKLSKLVPARLIFDAINQDLESSGGE